MKIFISKRLFLVDCFIFCTPHSFADNNNISPLPNGKPDFNGVWQVLNNESKESDSIDFGLSGNSSSPIAASKF